MKEWPDDVLVRRVQEGDREAFAVLHERYYTSLYRLAYLKLGSREEAEDLTQEVFYRALKHIKYLRLVEGQSAYPWLHRIAANLIADYYRSPARQVEVQTWPPEELVAYLESRADEGPSPYELVVRQEVRAALRAALHQLPPDQARAVDYRFFGELSIREIAAEMERPEGAVKSLLHRALQNLRQHLTQTAKAAKIRKVIVETSAKEQIHERRPTVPIRRRID